MSHSVCITSSGRAVALGRQDEGQCAVPALADGELYVSESDWQELGQRAWVLACLMARRSEDAEVQAVTAAMAGGLERTIWQFVKP